MRRRRSGYSGRVKPTPRTADLPLGLATTAAALPVTRPHVDAAARRIAGHVRQTPLLRLPGAALGVACAAGHVVLTDARRRRMLVLGAASGLRD